MLLNEKQPIRIVIAEDHPITRAGLRSTLGTSPDIVVIGEAKDGEEALRLVQELKPDVLLLDIEMPNLTGVEVAEQLRNMGSPVRLLALSAFDDERYVYGLLDRGAHGYLMKEEAEVDQIVSAVLGIASGDGELWISAGLANKLVRRRLNYKSDTHSSLSEREEEVLKLVALGFDNEHIAAELHLSKHTIKNHIDRIKNMKLGIRTRAELIAWAWQHGFVKPGEK